MTADPRTFVATHFDSWKAHDFGILPSILADDAVFDGPMGHVASADECTEAIKGQAGMVTDVVVTRIFVDGPDILTW